MGLLHKPAIKNVTNKYTVLLCEIREIILSTTIQEKDVRQTHTNKQSEMTVAKVVC